MYRSVYLPEPVVRIEFEETTCLSFDWANSEVVAIGTTHGKSSFFVFNFLFILNSFKGIIAVYDLGPELKAVNNPSKTIIQTLRLQPHRFILARKDHPIIANLFPTHYLSVHQSAVRALTWVRAPPANPDGVFQTDKDPTIIASGGYDGLECLTDIRDSRVAAINRTRGELRTRLPDSTAGQRKYVLFFFASSFPCPSCMHHQFCRCNMRHGVLSLRWWPGDYRPRECGKSVLGVAVYAGKGTYLDGSPGTCLGE